MVWVLVGVLLLVVSIISLDPSRFNYIIAYGMTRTGLILGQSNAHHYKVTIRFLNTINQRAFAKNN
jgi:hypothetical protein